MPFDRPTLSALIERGRADADARIPGADGRLPFSMLNGLLWVHAAGVNGLYGYLAWQSKQIFPDTAEVEFLDRWAAIWSVTRKAASFAAGSVDFTGEDSVIIPAGSELQRGDGVEYTTDADATIAAGTATAAVTAIEGGSLGNAVAGTTLNLVSPIAGIDSAATVAAGGITNGADAEDDEALRARLLDRIRTPPHGGNANDYEAWALEVAGVTRAWPDPLALGLGTVTLRFMTDDLTANGIPDAAKVTEVQDYIDARRPVTADLTVVAPMAVTLDFTITLTPNTAAVQAAVEAELKDLLLREAEPGGTILISHIREAISIAAGETNHVLTVPAADVAHTTGQIAVMGTITWA